MRRRLVNQNIFFLTFFEGFFVTLRGILKPCFDLEVDKRYEKKKKTREETEKIKKTKEIKKIKDIYIYIYIYKE